MTDAIPTIAEAARQIAARRLSPVELTRACLERVHALDDRLHAFVHVTQERALAEARAAEAAIIAAGPKGPLHGIPIGLKDIVDTKGVPTTCGSRLLQNNLPQADATCAERLAAAGTVLIGKTTTHEFADGGPSFDLPAPPARNPWNTEHFTAGSSSGTGAGVAAGLILGGIGTDTGGSIRGPAALCGIAGIKPTYGLVSRAGVAPAAFSLDHIGPMAWTAEDCALLLQALAGHDPRDPASASRPVPDYTAGLGADINGVRIGVIHHFHETDHKVSEATQRAITAAIATFRDLGAEIRETQLSPLQDWVACGSLISITERAPPMRNGRALGSAISASGCAAG
jgi:aspartyl-tRNA(Asn)/glutamyl-tRNA(Gln) amidotransferase subunit A